MNSSPMQQLSRATESVVGAMVANVFSMQENARDCKRMQDTEGQKWKTKPSKSLRRTAETRTGRGLSPRQRMAARMLLAGRTILQVAAELGVNPCTIHRWKNDRLFAAEIERLSGGIPLNGPIPPKTLARNSLAWPTVDEEDGTDDADDGLLPADKERHSLARTLAQLKEIQADRRR